MGSVIQTNDLFFHGGWCAVLGAAFVIYAMLMFADCSPARRAKGWRPVLPLWGLGLSLIVMGAYTMRP